MNMYRMGKWWVQVWDTLDLWAYSRVSGRIYLCLSISDQTAITQLSSAICHMQLICYLFFLDFESLLHRICVNAFSTAKINLFQNWRKVLPQYLLRQHTSLCATAIRPSSWRKIS